MLLSNLIRKVSSSVTIVIDLRSFNRLPLITHETHIIFPAPLLKKPLP